MHGMSVFVPGRQGGPPGLPTFATKAELADYLEAQADEVERLAAGAEGDRRLVEELAARFAALAREHELEFVAERFDSFAQDSATGTHGG